MAAADYSKWSNDQLIQRVTELEQRLSEQTNALKQEQVQAFTAPIRTKKPRAEGVFDPSKYSTRLIALKFAYLGQRYNGYEHHANNSTPLPTIEEELWKALMKARLIFPTNSESIKAGEINWEGCDYSKCGRTDRGVSAFGQVIGIRVRSNRPLIRKNVDTPITEGRSVDEIVTDGDKPGRFDPIEDELPYAQIINRLLPEDIRILAWCPNPPKDFSARFSCKERRYRYFFTQPAYAPTPGRAGFDDEGPSSRRDGWLDIEAMREAAKHLVGLHDFRNFCKVDPSKQITNFERRIFHADIEKINAKEAPVGFIGRPEFDAFPWAAPRLQTRSRVPWAPEETETLRRGVEDGLNERELLKLLPRRSLKAITNRKDWLRSLGDSYRAPTNTSEPIPVLKWTHAEDEHILQGRREGRTWIEIARGFNGRRSSDGCRNRWTKHLRSMEEGGGETETLRNKPRPEENFSSDSEVLQPYHWPGEYWWSVKDEEVLAREHQAGKLVKDIQKQHFPLRTVQAVKTHWTEMQAQRSSMPTIYSFTVHGSAFLWHQVRHLVAILFLVGQGLEHPSVVPQLLDIKKTPRKPMYEMATDAPLVLWDCIFPEEGTSEEDSLKWIYVGDQAWSENKKRKNGAPGNGKYGPGGLVDGLWTVWRKRKMDELLAGMLLDVVADQGDFSEDEDSQSGRPVSTKVFEGGDSYRLKGRYIPLMQRERIESPEIINARYAARKGLNVSQVTVETDEADE